MCPFYVRRVTLTWFDLKTTLRPASSVTTRFWCSLFAGKEMCERSEGYRTRPNQLNKKRNCARFQTNAILNLTEPDQRYFEMA